MSDSIVVDIETKINKALIAFVIFEGQNISPEDAYTQYQQQLIEKSGSDFMPIIFHEPLIIGYAHVNTKYEIKKVGTLPEGNEGVIKFWEAVNKGYRVVSWNGRCFDLPVLELAALRLGLQMPDYYNQKFGARYRFSEDGHYDLYDFITNSGAVYYRGGLQAVSQMIGLPGKTGSVRGHEVQAAYEAGRMDEIAHYCIGDVLLTCGIYFHIENMRGRLNREEYEHRIQDVKERIHVR